VPGFGYLLIGKKKRGVKQAKPDTLASDTLASNHTHEIGVEGKKADFASDAL